MSERSRNRVLFVTTYDPLDSTMGGASWADRRILEAFGVQYDVSVLTVAARDVVGEVPLELGKDARAIFSTLMRMALRGEPYQQAKFTWNRNWNKKRSALLRMAEKTDILITNQWPALLLADQAGLRPDIHIAHNVDWILAQRFDPLPFRLMNNPNRMKLKERALLGLPRKVFTLSTNDKVRLANEGIFAEHLPLAKTQPIIHSRKFRRIGFIGKMSWPPNRSAVQNLIDVVLPAVNSQLDVPIEVVLAGRGSEDFVERSNVRALGPVGDLTEFYDLVDAVVIPRLGQATGVSVKMLEALDRGVPVIAPRLLAADAGVELGDIIAADGLDDMINELVEYYAAKDFSHVSVPSNLLVAVDPEIPLIREISRLAGGVNSRKNRSLGESRLDAARRCIRDLGTLVDMAFESNRPERVQTVNLHHAHLARTMPDFRDAIDAADKITADGWPIVKYLQPTLGFGRLSRVTGSDFLQAFLADSRIEGKRIALIGGSHEAASEFDVSVRRAGAELVMSETGLRAEWDPSEFAATLKVLAPDFVLLAVTPPFGDLFARELQSLGAPGFKISIGGGLDMLVGQRKRAPSVFQTLGMEWVYRLVQDPKHLFRRYVLECIPTYALMQLHRLSDRNEK